MKVNWKAEAAKAREQGHIPGGPWEKSLERHLQNNCPKLVKELGEDLPSFLQATTFQAGERMGELLDQGTNPESAQELALNEMYPPAEPAEASK